MTVSVLLLTHEQMGDALIATAHHILGRMALTVEAHSIPPGSDVDSALHETLAHARRIDHGEGVLVLTDVYGATPSNVAERIAAAGPTIRRVSGLNLPMLLRVLNYAEQDLSELAQTAANGGRTGIRIDDA
jgi:PTS system ascorbate-specific IIA component